VIVPRLVAVVALLAAAFATGGCGAAMLARLDARAVDSPAEATFAPGAMRDVVERRLGPPTATVPLPDGSRLDRYAYTLRNPEWRPLKWLFAVGTVITVGFAEAAWVPYAALEWKRSARTATFAYDGDGQVVSLGPPPSYGPSDESVGRLSLDEIRERCRAEHRGGVAPVAARLPYEYDACVVRRLAIWGVE